MDNDKRDRKKPMWTSLRKWEKISNKELQGKTDLAPFTTYIKGQRTQQLEYVMMNNGNEKKETPSTRANHVKDSWTQTLQIHNFSLAMQILFLYFLSCHSIF